MRKFVNVLLSLVLLVGISACTVNDNTGNDDPKNPTDPTPQTVTYSIYIPNENANGFNVEVIETETITEDNVLNELKKKNVLPEEVSINSFRNENGLITIDFNEAFGNLVCSMGTSGELMIVGSVVNTFLDAYQAESFYFTVDGNVLESGHTIYDFELSFFNIEP